MYVVQLPLCWFLTDPWSMNTILASFDILVSHQVWTWLPCALAFLEVTGTFLILKNVHKDILLFKKQTKLLKFWVQILTAGLEIKNILRFPLGDQLEKYSRQMQTFSHQSV